MHVRAEVVGSLCALFASSDDGLGVGLRILHVVPAFVPAWSYGGPVAVAYEMSRALAAGGHEVTVWTTDAHAAHLPQRESIDGVTVVRFENRIRMSRPWNFQLPRGVRRATRSELSSYDVVHLHEFRTTLNVIVALEAADRGVPYVITGHGTMGVMPGRILKRAFDRLWGQRMLARASRVFVLSKDEHLEATALGARADKIFMVPNAIRPDDRAERADVGAFRRKYALSDRPIVLYLGRLHASKRLDLLVEAFNAVADAMNAQLVFVGPDQGQETRLRTRLATLKMRDCASFTGMLTGEEKEAALQSAAVFATPRYRGFPVSFLEAMRVGLPIVTTELGDRLDLLDEVGIVTVPTPDAYGRALVRALTEVEWRSRVAERGRALVAETYNWQSVARTLTEHYQRAVGSSGHL